MLEITEIEKWLATIKSPKLKNGYEDFDYEKSYRGESTDQEERVPDIEYYYNNDVLVDKKPLKHLENPVIAKFRYNSSNQSINLDEQQTQLTMNRTGVSSDVNFHRQTSNDVVNLMRNFASLQIQYDAMETELTLLRNSTATNNYAIDWRITNVAQQRKEYGHGKDVFSPIFCCYAIGGYCYQLRLYWNGRSDASIHDLSLYISLVTGPYDDRLEWPFNKRACISIIDHPTKAGSKVSSKTKTLHSASVMAFFKDLGRPGLNNTKGWGWRSFMKKNMLDDNRHNFVHNDSMTIRVTFEDEPI